jgi:imidazolonepropionase-like amidohydrolase
MRALLVNTVVASVALPFALAAQTVAITGGKVYPVNAPPIENGTVLMRDGKIVSVGANVTIPADAERIDATGKWVTPGLINSATTLGLVEISAEPGTRDMAARTGDDYVSAAFTVWEGLNTGSVMIAPAREDGVTSVVVLPSGGLISGQAALLNLVDGTVSEMVVKAPIAMVGEVGDKGAANVGARGELLVRLREVIEDTKSYARRKADFERAQTRPFSVSRLDLEAMIPVVEGRMPLIVRVDKSSDIDAALRIADEYKLRIIIGGGAEAWMVAERLAAAKVPVLTGAMNNIPGSFTTLGSRQENAALLKKAGVNVVLIGQGPGDPETFGVRNIRQEAGNAVAYGMTWDDALRAITLGPAELFGVANRVGSLQAGRDANVVVWSGDPFEMRTQPERVFIHGKAVERTSRQELLGQRYKTLPPSYRKP